MNSCDKLLVKCEEESGTHPHCPHGPMLLFYRASSPADAYFSCSAFRDGKTCAHRLKASELTDSLKKKRYPVETCDYKKIRCKIKSVPGSSRSFCHTCNLPYVQLESELHSDHQTIKGITEEMLLNPTSFMKPLDNDKAEAQYYFDKESLDFFLSCLQQCNNKKVICIGTPRLHAHLRTCTSIKSFLLDSDHRFFYFYDDGQFAWYNMCNNHFFVEKQREAFKEFLRMDVGETLAIFTDPPFGCRTEVVANSIKQITNQYRSVNTKHESPAVFWVYPYFCESYIQETAPEFDMCDYKINYTNHESYSNGVKGRKLGSPVRLFTNVPLEKIALPLDEGYKYCSACNRWTAKDNIHCEICRVCPSKNGAPYRHCPWCRICVKPNYIHCGACRRCTQRDNHDCTAYQKKIRCWICTQVGHNEYNCQAIKPLDKTAPFHCFLCRKPAPHNEKSCPRRRDYFHEHSFMGDRTIELKRRNKK